MVVPTKTSLPVIWHEFEVVFIEVGEDFEDVFQSVEGGAAESDLLARHVSNYLLPVVHVFADPYITFLKYKRYL